MAAFWRLQQQVEEAEGAFPLLGPGVLQVGVDDPEGAGERHAQSSHDGGETGLDLLAEGQVERGPRGKLVQDRLQLDLLVDALEVVDALLQALGDGQVGGLDDGGPSGIGGPGPNWSPAAAVPWSPGARPPSGCS